MRAEKILHKILLNSPPCLPSRGKAPYPGQALVLFTILAVDVP
jgi:hypothetical protein